VATYAGSPVYMSPEMLKFQYDNKVNIKFNTDVWSYGIVIYELITLKRPFRTDHEIINSKVPDLDSDLFKDLIKEYISFLFV